MIGLFFAASIDGYLVVRNFGAAKNNQTLLPKASPILVVEQAW